MPVLTPNAASIQQEVTHYTSLAWDQSSAVLDTLTLAQAELAPGTTGSAFDPALLSFELTETSDARTGVRRITLNAAKAEGFFEVNTISPGLVSAEIKNKLNHSSVFHHEARLAEAPKPKATEDLCHNMVRALLLA
jgi:hypothetical protein